MKASGTKIRLLCPYWLFENPFFLDGYLTQLSYSRKALGPSQRLCALLSLRSRWGGGKYGVNGRREGSE